MPERVRVHRSTENSTQYQTTAEEADALADRDTDSQASQERRQELDADTKKLLEDIDSVLETNAAQFVIEYVQEGGE